MMFYAFTAAVLGSRQMQVVPKEAEQFLIVCALIVFSVDIDCIHLFPHLKHLIQKGP